LLLHRKPLLAQLLSYLFPCITNVTNSSEPERRSRPLFQSILYVLCSKVFIKTTNTFYSGSSKVKYTLLIYGIFNGFVHQPIHSPGLFSSFSGRTFQVHFSIISCQNNNSSN